MLSFKPAHSLHCPSACSGNSCECQFCYFSCTAMGQLWHSSQPGENIGFITSTWKYWARYI